jgi:hypothetical protein
MNRRKIPRRVSVPNRKINVFKSRFKLWSLIDDISRNSKRVVGVDDVLVLRHDFKLVLLPPLIRFAAAEFNLLGCLIEGDERRNHETLQ